MSDTPNPSDENDEDMSQYLQTFLDETEEQLDDLVETMLSLEKESTNRDDLNEAFRLIHSIKGSAGMMGLDHITVLTHHLENRFERFRSGAESLDDATMSLVLRCIDFLRQCGERLRAGEAMGSPAELLEELKRLELLHSATAETPGRVDSEAARGGGHEEKVEGTPIVEILSAEEPLVTSSVVCMVVRFRDQLQLADLKAELIVNRLSGLAELREMNPAMESWAQTQNLGQIEIRLATDLAHDRLRDAADVEGVESIEFRSLGEDSKALTAAPAAEPPPRDVTLSDHLEIGSPPTEDTIGTSETPAPPPVEIENAPVDPAPVDVPAEPSLSAQPIEPAGQQPVPAGNAADLAPSEKATSKVSETMRVDIDRLDNLMNLAGELVVNRARFEQISSQISPARGRSSSLHQIREFCDNLRYTVAKLGDETAGPPDRRSLAKQLRSGLELIDEHAATFENDRRHLEQFSEAIDQLSRVSQGMQQGVLETRMVPVGPLFSRFKRVVRDLSKERGKRVNLVVRGEKTELDKRMIDELGDPLVHLVRNSLDHGLESPEDRLRSDKPEVGTIYLEAEHSGNNVYVHVRDDGRGIDIDRIKAKLIANQILSSTVANDLSDDQALDYIWHPGFSTAQAITDISGRGVGMDVVQNRIRRLNGNVEVTSVPQRGTHFRIRLPLTLAIINCLLVRLRGIAFSIPIDDVREIVSVNEKDVITIQGKKTFDVRDEFIALVGIDEIFSWHDIDYGFSAASPPDPDCDKGCFEVVILRSAGKAVGLRVSELFGSRDIVIKSLSDNFIDIRGISGASILGDGSVCLMLDVATVVQMAGQTSVGGNGEEIRK